MKVDLCVRNVDLCVRNVDLCVRNVDLSMCIVYASVSVERARLTSVCNHLFNVFVRFVTK